MEKQGEAQLEGGEILGEDEDEEDGEVGHKNYAFCI